MLGRNSYTNEEFDQGKAAIERQIAAYKTLVKAIDNTTPDKKLDASLAAFEPLCFNNMVVALDRYFVHRLRTMSGKDGNPLNEVFMLSESLTNNNGVLQDSTVIKYVPEKSVLQLQIGDTIAVTADEFERLAAAFFEDLKLKFLKA
jgi:hypothetical protein